MFTGFFSGCPIMAHSHTHLDMDAKEDIANSLNDKIRALEAVRVRENESVRQTVRQEGILTKLG